VLNGKYLVATSAGRCLLYDAEWIAGWTEDDSGLYVYSRNQIPVKLIRLDRKTGRREVGGQLK
jgi:hypothetical protein